MRLVRKIGGWLVVISFAYVIAGCSYTTDLISDHYLFPSDKVRAPSYDVTRTEGEFTTSDGVTLAADIYIPKGLEKAPSVLVRIPFSRTFGNQLRTAFIARHWARRGYAVVIQGTRGRYNSGGKFYPLIHERSDGIETLRWLAQQPWYDGRLAMWGGSAFGHAQWAVADQTNPGPKAYFVQIASSDFRRMFYSGNAFSLESALYWAIRSRGDHDREVDVDDLEKGARHLPLIESDDVAIGDTDFFNDWLLKRNDDDYWNQIDGVNRPATLAAPMLLLGGWFDPFLPKQLEDFKSIKMKANAAVASETRLIIGPWAHAQSVKLPANGAELPYRVESVVPSVPWFDHILGVTQEALNMPPVKIFVMGENRWRDENEWPLARTIYSPYLLCSGGRANTLGGNGTLDSKLCNSHASYDSYRYEPLDPVPSAGGAMLSGRAGIQLQNSIEERNDVLVYTTSALTENVEVTGPIRAILYVATDAPSTDFTAKLVDVFPDGAAFNLSDGILRQNYSASDKPVRVEFELWPTSNVFFKGHKIRVEISSSNFPRYDRNLNTGESNATTSRLSAANQKIFHSVEYPSQIVLPVIDNQSLR